MHFLQDIKSATEYAYHYLLLPPPGVCGCMPFNNCSVLRPTSAMPSMTGQFKHLGLTDAIMNLSPWPGLKPPPKQKHPYCKSVPVAKWQLAFYYSDHGIMGLSPAGNKIQQHITAQSLSKSPSHQPDMAEKKKTTKTLQVLYRMGLLAAWICRLTTMTFINPQ